MLTPIEETDISKANNKFTIGTTYDDSSAVISDNKFRQMNFDYDANGRMVKATKANTPDAFSVYDGSGMRVAERVNDVWRFLVYDLAGNVVAEYGGLTPSDEGGIKYLLTDWQGSTRAILSNSGFVQARMDYQAFGEGIGANVGLRTTTQGFGANQGLKDRYALTKNDEATGLNHTPWRKQEQKAGRWTSPDPYRGSTILSRPQSWNRYAYVENQPTDFIDPTGLGIWIKKCYQSCAGYTDETGFHQSCETDCRWEYIDIGSSVGGSPPVGDPRGGGGGSETPKPSCTLGSLAYGVASCVAKCVNDNRVDKFFKAVGDSTGSTTVGDILQGLSVVGTGAALVNEGLNLRFGGKPAWTATNPDSSRLARTSWQHKAFGTTGIRGWLQRITGTQMRWLSNFGKAFGRAAFYVSVGLLAFEGGYTVGTVIACQALCALKNKCSQ